MNGPSDVVPRWEEICAAIDGRGMGLLERFVAQESVSDGEKARPIPFGITNILALVREAIQAIPGAVVEVHQTSTYPVVTATVLASDTSMVRPTVLLYGMGDTRPIGNPGEWTSKDPLKLEKVTVDGEDRWLGRGIFNSKSGLAGMIEVVCLLAGRGQLPVNVVLLIDFEEEVRVDSVTEVVVKYRDLFTRCNAAFMPLCAEKFDIYLGAKGVAVARVTFKEDRTSAHSGIECVRKLPLLRRAVADFLSQIEVDSDDYLVMGGESDESVVTESDVALAQQISRRLNRVDFAKQMGVQPGELRHSLVWQLVLDQMRPHINVLSWQSERCEGVLPTRAFVELEYRLPPSGHLDREAIESRVRQHIIETASIVLPRSVSIDSAEFVAGTGAGFRGAALDDPTVGVLQRSYGMFGVERPLSPCLWGSCPEGAVIVKELKIPFLFGGLGCGGHAHVPDEYIVDGAYERFKKWLVVFLHQCAWAYAK